MLSREHEMYTRQYLSKYLHIYRAEMGVNSFHVWTFMLCNNLFNTWAQSFTYDIGLDVCFSAESFYFMVFFTLVYLSCVNMGQRTHSWILYLNWLGYLLQCSMCINISFLYFALLSFVFQNYVSLTWRVAKKKNMNQKYAWLAKMAIQNHFQWVLIQIWCWEISLR